MDVYAVAKELPWLDVCLGDWADFFESTSHVLVKCLRIAIVTLTGCCISP